jgi:predicted transcriptional regulator
LRREADLTQEELARHADVSQSLIAKIESGRVEPTYSKAKHILAVLRDQRHSDELVKSYMTGEIISVVPEDTVGDVVSVMKDRDISQVPVMEEDVKGLITESSLVRASHDADVLVDQVMKAAPPVVASSTPIEAVRSLLLHCPLVLVREGEDFVGVVTKADLLRAGF